MNENTMPKKKKEYARWWLNGCILVWLMAGAGQVSGQDNDYVRSERKLMYKVIDKAKHERRAKVGEYVTIKWRYYIQPEKILFTSETKEEGNQRFKVEEDGFKGDYKEIFKLLGEGDSALVKIPVNFFFPRILGKDRPKEVSGKAEVIMEFRMVKIQTALEIREEEKARREQSKIEEPSKILAFLEEQKWEERPTASGLYIKVLKEGTGRDIKEGSTITVRYKGFLTNGKQFDATRKGEPDFQFTIGQKQVIEGWEEAVLQQKVGAKVVLLIPSNLGYGAGGFPGTIVGPFEPLVFEMEISGHK